jgi:HTH-type transcriptional regulator/antitoxin HigA
MAPIENDDFFVPGLVKNHLETANDHLLYFLKNQKFLPWNELDHELSKSEKIALLVGLATELASLQGSRALFRKRDDSSDALVSFWLSQVISDGKLLAIKNPHKKFEGISEEDLSNIAKLSTDIKSTQSIQDILLEKFGIVLIIKPAYKSIKLDGVSLKLQDGTPLIGLSLRYSRLDYFWFTLLHELSHVALHYTDMTQPIIDDLDEDLATDIEIEANRLAADSIIPRHIFTKSSAIRSLSDKDLIILAEKAGVHPILAAGLLRNKTKNYRAYAKLVNSIDTREIFGIKK